MNTSTVLKNAWPLYAKWNRLHSHKNMFIWNINRRRLQGDPLTSCLFWWFKKKKELWRFSQEHVGFPGSHRYIITWWVSGWPAFLLEDFTEIDPGACEVHSISRGRLLFSPKVRCGSEQFCTWKQTGCLKLILCDHKTPSAFSTLGASALQTMTWLFIHISQEKEFSDTPGLEALNGAMLPPRDTWQCLGAALSPPDGAEWWRCSLHPVGSPRTLSIPSRGHHSGSHWQYCWGWEALL